MRISVLGLGHVGCVTAAGLAHAGHEVFGIDDDCDKVAQIVSSASPIVEPGLEALVAAGVASGRLRATVDSRRAVANSELALICVGTPSRPDGQRNTDALVRVSAEIGEALRDGLRPFTVVVRSTVLPGTIERLVIPAIARGAGHGPTVHVASNPEFMREGSSVHDFAHPPFTLVGAASPEPIALLRALYATVADAPFVDTTIATAEMVKYVSNAFHAVKVAFANQIGDICEAVGADAREVARIFLSDARLNAPGAGLEPGFAFDGSCLTKNLQALVRAARSADRSAPLLQDVAIRAAS